ncbi:hypothetical protein HMPREF1547_03472 [Blautia sp. KLE 1732]|jgi:hypothetical protein|nr:hypothetical protein HMPREF1547_03472 [Blautia sp. KLE 1732]
MQSDKFPAEIGTQITKCNKNLLYPKERVKQIFFCSEQRPEKLQEIST